MNSRVVEIRNVDWGNMIAIWALPVVLNILSVLELPVAALQMPPSVTISAAYRGAMCTFHALGASPFGTRIGFDVSMGGCDDAVDVDPSNSGSGLG